MKFRDTPLLDDSQIDITPLIDIVFLLLIFFMVSTTFKAESKISVELPKASNNTETPIEPLVELSLDSNGIIEYKGNIIALESLGEILTTITEGNKDKPIMIRADRNVTHGVVVGVIDQTRKSGFGRISIATKVDQFTSE